MKYLKLFSIIALVAFVITSVGVWQGMHTFVFAWVLNLMLMMGVLFYTQTFKPPLSSKYYNIKSWERNGTIYERLGVNLFRKMLVLIGWEKLNKASNPVKKNIEALKHLEYTTRQSEFGHLFIFLIVLAINFFVGIKYGVDRSVWLLILNILLNLFPVMVQRYNRPRLLRALSLYQITISSSPTCKLNN